VFSGNKPDKRFLGYKFQRGFLTRDSFEFFNLALHPEREVDCLEKSYSRMVAYMHMGGVSDIQFSRFFEWYQSGYPIADVSLMVDKDMMNKKEYGGLNFEVKSLHLYTLRDFLWGPVTRKT